MSKSKAAPGPEGTQQIQDFLDSLEHPQLEGFRILRRIILDADDRIQEGIKWNSASFYSNDWFATFNLRSLDSTQVILHTGAKIKANRTDGISIDDPESLLKWLATDRCLMSIKDKLELEEHSDSIKNIVKQWVDLMFKSEG